MHGKGRVAVALISAMMEEGITPDGGLFSLVLSAWSHAVLVDDGKEIF